MGRHQPEEPILHHPGESVIRLAVDEHRRAHLYTARSTAIARHPDIIKQLATDEHYLVSEALASSGTAATRTSDTDLWRSQSDPPLSAPQI